MTKKAQFLFRIWLTISTLSIWQPSWGQDQKAITDKDRGNIKFAARTKLKALNTELLNALTDPNMDRLDVDELIKTSYEPGPNQIFDNSSVIIEDDIDPNHISHEKTSDSPVAKYLNDLYLFYPKRANSKDQPTIIFSNLQDSDVQQSGNMMYLKIFFRSDFKGQHTKIDKPYQPAERVAEMKVTKVNNKWTVFITRLAFARPGEGLIPLAEGDGKPTIPTNLTISGPEVVFQQPDDRQNVTLKFNKVWLEVTKSETSELPTGFYKRQDKAYVYDRLNSIEFEKNNTRFVFHKGQNFKAYERQLSEKELAAKARKDSLARVAAMPKPVVKPPVVAQKPKEEPKTNTTPTPTVAQAQIRTDSAKIAANKPAVTQTKNQKKSEKQPNVKTTLPDTAGRIAVTTIKPREELKQELSTPASVPDVSVISPKTDTSSIALKAPEVAKPKPQSSVLTPPKSRTVSPALAQSLSAAAQKEKARLRTMGWLQIVAGVAGLAGSYMGYSAIKKDYDVYRANVDKLNVEYNSWLDVARQPAGPAMETMSLTSYGKPGIYGAYAGGVVSVGALINGIRSLGKAGKIKPKPAR
ncbi:hypothetical protein GCM10028807_60440 [Spirosoma daeguense]